MLAERERLESARVIVAVAGMEGALPSVIGGLVRAPVIAVPTSIGYGASFGGLTALLGMLNSCASGVAVVNIDNGFGGAAMASRHQPPGLGVLVQARTLQALEFDQIVEVVQGLALTPLGAVELRQLRPLTDPRNAKKALSTTTECVRYLDTNAPLDLQGDRGSRAGVGGPGGRGSRARTDPAPRTCRLPGVSESGAQGR